MINILEVIINRVLANKARERIYKIHNLYYLCVLNHFIVNYKTKFYFKNLTH